MKKILMAVAAMAMALTMSVAAFAEGSIQTLSNGAYVAAGTATMTVVEKTAAENAVAWENSQGNTAAVVDVAEGFVGDFTVAIPCTAGANVYGYKIKNGATVSVPVTAGNGYVSVYSDGNNCPYVIVVAGGASAAAATGTSPKTGLY